MTNRTNVELVIALAIFSLICATPAQPSTSKAAALPPGGALTGERYRVIVSSDIGGSDPDDFQSMVHLLAYADVFDLEGLIASPPGNGRAADITEVIDDYQRDFLNLNRHSTTYPTPGKLRAITKQGAVDPAPKGGFSEPTEGSKWIIERAHATDERPLYVLVWGSITDVAQALHDDPAIKKKLRVYYVGSWNTKSDPFSRDYVYDQHPDLWLVEADTTFRGMYIGGQQDGDLGNRGFIEQHVKGHGALGNLLVRKKNDIKMGDSPSVLYLLRGNPDDPTSEHWGGAFVRTDHGPNYWTDDPNPALREGDRAGARTVNKWRADYLRDWQMRMARTLAAAKSNTQLITAESGGLRAGAAAAEFEADDSMIIAGSIGPGKATGQEGKLRAVAVVIEKKPLGKLAIVACDILMITREHLDPVMAEIEKTTGIPTENILINCTHTHHAPSTMVVHGYGLDETFTKRVQRGIVKAVQDANANLSKDDCRFYFQLGEEKTVGQNSRVLLSDGSIYWIGPRDDFVRPTGPFDPELPVLAFRDSADKLHALIFNHSTHSIGTRKGGVRSPSFYGLAAQELETDLSGTVCFLEGASGSTHNLNLKCDEMTKRIKQAVQDALTKAQPRPVEKLAAIKRPFKFKVRDFDEAREEETVTRYCRKYAPAHADQIIPVFRNMRNKLASQRGQERETWLQVLRIGDVAIVAVPAEFFTQLGLDIKNRSPFRHTYIAELANDWIGYIPNQEGHKLGGYQCWTGFHSYAEPGTGERIVDETVAMLKELAR
jgi:hypothetical protein